MLWWKRVSTECSIGPVSLEEASLKNVPRIRIAGRILIGAVKKLQSAGLQVLGGYIVGFDHDDESIFSKQIKFIQESGVVAAMVSLLEMTCRERGSGSA